MHLITGFALRRKLLVVVLAVVAFLGGLAATPLGIDRLSEETSHPGDAAYRTNQEILDRYGTGGPGRPFVPVVTLPAGTELDDPRTQRALRRAYGAVARERHARVVSYGHTRDEALAGDDGRTTYGLVYLGETKDGSPAGGGLGEVPDESPAIARLLGAELPAGSTVRVTGLDPLAPGADAGGLNVPVKIGFGALAALVVLLLVFRSALALLPLVVAAVAIPASLGPLFALTAVTTVHDSALRLVPLLGLGIAVDYALIVVSRWREERARGHRGDDAVHRAMATAGHSVAFSGAAIALGLVTMVVLPVPFLRSIGYAGLLVAVVSVLVSLTLLPVLLSVAGHRLDRRQSARYLHADRRWSAWARGVVRFRWLGVLGAGGALVALTVVGLGANMRVPETENLLQSGPGHQGLVALTDAGIPTGAVTPFDVLVHRADPTAVAAELASVPGVHAVLAPDDASWRRDGTALVTVVPAAETGSVAGEQTLRRVRATLPADAELGGDAAQNMDSVESTYRLFPVLLALMGLVTLVLLSRAFRSPLLAVKAVLLNLLSLGAVMGAMVLLWQYGWGTEWLLDIQATGTIGQFVPVTILAFLYGLSTDYEVFILARIREEYERTGSTHEAVVQGIGRTGRLVTAAALILFSSFVALAAGPELDVKVFASGLAIGILLDATVVRALLVPAAVAVMGRWNWWAPRWAVSRRSGCRGFRAGPSAPRR